jgi:signal peptidase II
VVSHLPLHGVIGADALVSIDHVENSGAAFGLFPQFPWLYLIVASVVVVYILLAGHRYGTGAFRQVLLGMILGGAISNGIDRLLQGRVVDFIDLHWWPVFNVADMCIVVGIVLAVLTLGSRRPVEPSAA